MLLSKKLLTFLLSSLLVSSPLSSRAQVMTPEQVVQYKLEQRNKVIESRARAYNAEAQEFVDTFGQIGLDYVSCLKANSGAMLAYYRAKNDMQLYYLKSHNISLDCSNKATKRINYILEHKLDHGTAGSYNDPTVQRMLKQTMSLFAEDFLEEAIQLSLVGAYYDSYMTLGPMYPKRFFSDNATSLALRAYLSCSYLNNPDNSKALLKSALTKYNSEGKVSLYYYKDSAFDREKQFPVLVSKTLSCLKRAN